MSPLGRIFKRINHVENLSFLGYDHLWFGRDQDTNSNNIGTVLVDTLPIHPSVCQLKMKLHSCSLEPIVIPGQVDKVGMHIISRNGNDTTRRKVSSSLCAKLRIQLKGGLSPSKSTMVLQTECIPTHMKLMGKRKK